MPNNITIPQFNAQPITNPNGLVTKSWSIFFQEIWSRIGGGKDYSLGGNLTTNITPIGNVLIGEDNLITYNLPAKSLTQSINNIEIIAFGTFAANANLKRLKLYFGSTVVFDTTALAFNNRSWSLKSNIIRLNDLSESVITDFSCDTTLLPRNSNSLLTTEDLSSNIIIKCTGEAIANNDIVQNGLIIRMYPI